ncbi:MAG TPA: EscU/YscU/HrcU family type III secretion system export apparatus switch protein [Polyangiaceae bacterium]
MSDKTEEATPRKLRKAREEGDSGASTFAAQAVAFVVAVALAPSAVRALAGNAADSLRLVLSHAGDHEPVRVDPVSLATTVVSLTFPVLVAAGIAGAVAQLVQTGGVVATKRLTPKLERLDPFEGIKGIFSTTRLFAVLRALVAGTVVAWLAFRGLGDHIVDVARVGGRSTLLAGLVAEVAGTLAWRAALVGLGLGVLDLVVTRGAWLRKMRMTKEEIRREHKDAEGDPQQKAAREKAHHELLSQATIASVRTASVVVVNPTHLACALRYDANGDAAPVVVASGEGELARRIVQAAEQWSVPVVQDVPLARALLELEVGEAIPEVLYEAVATILGEVGSVKD